MNNIGHYRVIRKLGAGGMGSVYLAQDDRLDRTVAVKVLQSELLNSSAARLRFEREAKSIARLAHPNVTVLHEIGEHAGAPFLVMEFVEGQPLSERTALGPLPITDFLNYAIQIAEALQHAHERDVIHRDIKSSNVMITAANQVKLLDFGLAQLGASSDSQTTKLTEPGSWVGTMHYAAPEVLSGRVADEQSDIYSLGVLLYEMATGKLPFGNLSGYALVTAILHGQAAPLAHFNPTFPLDLANVITRAMALAPKDRFTNARELATLFSSAHQTGKLDVAASAESAPSMMIFPFANLSQDPSLDWLSVGINETLNSDLAKVGQFRLISPESSKPSSQTDPAKSAADSGARWCLTGGYQRSGNRVRITPRLIETSTGKVAYSGKIDGAWDDIFELQDRVVKELVEALQLKIGSSSMQRVLAPDTARLEAYEHFAQARKSFLELGKSSLEDAKRHLERALELDPKYAVAHSAMGAVYAMRFIHRTDPDDLARAASHLEKALELDSELAEPHVYLCYVYARLGNLKEALREGSVAVKRQPDLGKAHYFYAAALVGNGEVELKYQQEAASELLACMQVDPRWTAALTVAATLAIVAGEPERALDFLDRQAKIEHESGGNKFPGLEMLRGAALIRRGEFLSAVAAYETSLKQLEILDFMYRDAFVALSRSGLGETRMRMGNPDLALPEFRRAHQTICESRILGGERVLTRALCGMISAYAATGDLRRAQQLLADLPDRLAAVMEKPETWIWDTFVAQLCYCAAEAHLRTGDREQAMKLLRIAVNKGWRDANWMSKDPVFEPLRHETEFHTIVAASRDLPRLDFSYDTKQMGTTSAN